MTRKKPPPPEALTLLALRSERRWAKKRLSTALGFSDDKQISRLERGERTLSRKTLDEYAAYLGHPTEAVDALLFAFRLISPKSRTEISSPIALSADEHLRLGRAALAVAWTAAEGALADLVRRRKLERAAAARAEARALWSRLKAATRPERRLLVTGLPEFRSWALAEEVCHQSEGAAAHKTEKALELADLALFIAEQVPGETSWRARLQGYCWAYVANARRVANDFDGAAEAFARAWDLWRAGAESDPELLAEWRLPYLEASLRRAQHRFQDALELLDRALASSRGDGEATARILLKKEHVYEQKGDIQAALAALTEAAPFVAASRDPRLLFALRFKMVNNLCHLTRYAEAADLLPAVRELAVSQADELSLIRVVWLSARVAAGEGRSEEAMSSLEQVCRTFTEQELPYDAALASLDLAVLWLEAGRTADVRELAVGMTWIFKAQKIHREALAALSLFCEAAKQETATVATARQAIASIEKARGSAPRSEEKRGRK